MGEEKRMTFERCNARNPESETDSDLLGGEYLENEQPVPKGNWRDGFLLSEPTSQEFIASSISLLVDFVFSQGKKIKWCATKASEVVELGNRLDQNICDFQAEMRDGKIYAGRTPMPLNGIEAI